MSWKGGWGGRQVAADCERDCSQDLCHHCWYCSLTRDAGIATADCPAVKFQSPPAFPLFGSVSAAMKFQD